MGRSQHWLLSVLSCTSDRISRHRESKAELPAVPLYLPACSGLVSEASHQLHRVPEAQQPESQQDRQGGKQRIIPIDLDRQTHRYIRSVYLSQPHIQTHLSPAPHSDSVCGWSWVSGRDEVADAGNTRPFFTCLAPRIKALFILLSLPKASSP